MSRGWRLALPLGFLVAIHLASLFGGFLAPNSPIEQNRDFSWAPPTKLRFIDEQGRFHLRPFVYPLVPDPEELGRYREDRSKPYRVRYLVRGEPYRLAGLFPADLHYLGVDPPATLFFLGTDGFGRDLFARLLVGGRVSLFAGLLAAAIALAAGTLFGVTAGYCGGTIDRLLMRTVELFLALPWLYLLLALRAFLPLTLSPSHAFLAIVLLIGLLGWARPARLMRSVALAATQQAFVVASRSAGSTHYRLITRHVLPHLSSVLLTQAALLPPAYVLAEVTLSFFGLGLGHPHPSLGTLIAELQNYDILTSHTSMFAPIILILFTFLAYFSLQATVHRSLT